MPTKRCFICGSYKRIEDMNVCCADCEERELDLLIAVYAYIHVSGNEYCPANEIIDNVGDSRKIKPNINFFKSWVNRGWLQKNDLESLRVPPTLHEELEECGFSASPEVMETLNNLRGTRPKHNPTLIKNLKNRIDDEKNARTGMAFIDRKRNRD